MEPLPPRPKVLAWYRAYCFAMGLMYVVVFVAGIVVTVLHDKLAEDKESSAIFWIAYGAFIAFLGLVLAGAFVAALFLPAKPWVSGLPPRADLPRPQLRVLPAGLHPAVDPVAEAGGSRLFRAISGLGAPRP